MKNTGVYHNTDILKNEAAGYSFLDGNFQKAANWNMSHAGGAGNLYSTVGDLFLWNEAVFNGRVLSNQSLETAFTPVSLDDGSEASAFGSGYGYGWMISKHRGLKQIAHSGGLHGFITYLTRFPEQNITIAVLHNAAPSRDVNPSQAALALAEIYFWEDMESQESFSTDRSIDPAIYDAYTGKYELAPNVIIAIYKEDGRLFAQLTGQPNFEIFPRSETTFFFKVAVADITFVKNDDGEVDSLILAQGGRKMPAKKVNGGD